jgi:hypothetical protein
MKQRGRVSKAKLNTAHVAVDGSRMPLEPPPHLSTKEAAIFREVIMSAPSSQFSNADVYLLASLATVTALIREASKAATKADDQNRVARHKTLFEAIKTQTLLCTKLRLTVQARSAAPATARAHSLHSPSVYDEMKAWGIEDDDDTRN